MFIRFACLLTLALATALPAHATDCSLSGISKAWALVQDSLVADPEAIAHSQRHINVMSANANLVVDGIWGPQTERAVCGMLELYGEVNGLPPDEMIRNPGEARAFVEWLEAAARSVTNPPLPAPPD